MALVTFYLLLTMVPSPSSRIQTMRRGHYVGHVKAMTPDMVIVSVGKNSYGHPDSTALEFYKKYSRGSNKGHKLYRTDQQGTMKLLLKAGGGWSLSVNQ